MLTVDLLLYARAEVIKSHICQIGWFMVKLPHISFNING